MLKTYTVTVTKTIVETHTFDLQALSLKDAQGLSISEFELISELEGMCRSRKGKTETVNVNIEEKGK